ncbi:MAG: M20 family metallopeptidase [Bryobacteraceae bacterium]|nr:M20 family metallopeptidase [Bryobacteraceae bacterium]
MDSVLAHVRNKQNAIQMFVRELVECESPSDDAALTARCAELFAARIGDIASVHTTQANGGFGPHLVCEFHLPGGKKDGQILLLGHLDTVYRAGTLRVMPFHLEAGRMHGPGVFDMKGGLAIFCFAMRALIELDIPVRRRVLLQVNSDEEMGSPTSRALTERNAENSVAVIVGEPAAGLDGKAKTSRKGVGNIGLIVKGKAAHAGLDFTAGASAITELALQINTASGFTDMSRGVTVNPGVISGGTRTNVVADHARCDFDIRVAKTKDWNSVERKFRSLKPVDKRCSLAVEGGLNRPPLEKTPAISGMFRNARGIAKELDVVLNETSVGGGSDGNFTAALGIPTLDGMGAVGDGAHTAGEYLLTDRLPDRVALVARLIQTL